MLRNEQRYTKEEEKVIVTEDKAEFIEVGSWGITQSRLRGVMRDKNGELHFV